MNKRNVNTQHGCGDTVDEENIVVLRTCSSPVATGESSETVDGQDNTETQVLWFEPFEIPTPVSDYIYFIL